MMKPRSWYAVVFPQLMEAQRSAVMLQRLCLHAQAFTSWVSIEMPNALLLELRGSVTLFGSLERLHADLDEVWRALRLSAHSATAPTLAALWFARAAKRVLIEDPAALPGQLADVPLTCTSWDATWLQTLRSMGVMNVGELLRLPRAGVARRLGPAAIRDLDVALGRQAAPRRAFVPRERFRERCDFESEIDTVLYLEKALEPLIERCAGFLRERQAGVEALELRLRHRVMAPTRVHLGLAGVTSERRRLTDVLGQKLSRLELSAPVRSVELISGTLRPLSADSLDVFGSGGTYGGTCGGTYGGIGGGPGRGAGVGSAGRDTAPQLVERLRARLGEQSVYGVSPVAEHRPEAAWQRVQELLLTAAVRAGARTGARAGQQQDRRLSHQMPRPVWLLADPVRMNLSDVILEQGPERIESGWWDGKGVARDYYIARRPQGSRWWIFQERQSRCWYLHGVFA